MLYVSMSQCRNAELWTSKSIAAHLSSTKQQYLEIGNLRSTIYYNTHWKIMAQNCNAFLDVNTRYQF